MVSQPSHLDGSWQGAWRHSGVPSSSLFNYHWASRTWREQEALDLNDSSLFSIAPTLKPAPEGSAILAEVQKKMSPEGDGQGLCGQMVVGSNKDYPGLEAPPVFCQRCCLTTEAAGWRTDQKPSLFILDFQREALLHFSSCVTRRCILTVWFREMKSDGCSDASWQKCPDRHLEEHQWSLIVHPPPYFLLRFTFHVILYHWHPTWKWPTTV